MKDDNKKKKKILPEDRKNTKRVKEIDPKEKHEQEELFSKADSISPINKSVNHDEIVKLRGGNEINLDEYVLENYVTEKAIHYFTCFYDLISNLLGVPKWREFVKPPIVPMLKKFLIYGRFPNAVQQRIYSRNKYIGYFSRICWNYQWLTKDADLQLRGFIDDFQKEGERVLAEGGDIKKFIVEYCNKFSLPIQLSLFDLE